MVGTMDGGSIEREAFKSDPTEEERNRRFETELEIGKKTCDFVGSLDSNNPFIVLEGEDELGRRAMTEAILSLPETGQVIFPYQQKLQVENFITEYLSRSNRSLSGGLGSFKDGVANIRLFLEDKNADKPAGSTIKLGFFDFNVEEIDSSLGINPTGIPLVRSMRDKLVNNQGQIVHPDFKDGFKLGSLFYIFYATGLVEEHFAQLCISYSGNRFTQNL